MRRTTGVVVFLTLVVFVAVSGAGSEQATAPVPAATEPTQMTVDGGIEAGSFTGDGSTLTDLTATNITPGGTANISILGNAATATSATSATEAAALTANPTDCGAGEFATAIDAAGNLTCAAAGIDHGFGSDNVRVGPNALVSPTTPGGNMNSAFGSSALRYTTSGYANTASGAFALMYNQTGKRNTAVGARALRYKTLGNDNTATGYEALKANTDGDFNTAVGSSALYSSTGSLSTAVGTWALQNATGSGNTALGQGAGQSVTTGSYNIHIGNTGAAGDTAAIKIGTQYTQTKAYVAGIYGTPLSGSNVVVTASGQLGTSTVTTSFNTVGSGTNTSAAMVVGTGASLGASGSGTITATTAGMATVLASNPTDCGAGQFATAIDASGNLTCAPDGGIDHGFPTGNTAVGSGALVAPTGYGENTAMGYNSLQSNGAGYYNTAVGSRSLLLNSTGAANTAVGFQSLQYNTIGNDNTALGVRALQSTTSGGNTAVGKYALRDNTTGSSNVAIGYGAGIRKPSGSNNIFIGAHAGTNVTGGHYNILIGNPGYLGDTGRIRIGQAGGYQNSTYIAGIYSTYIPGGNYVKVDAAGKLGTTVSSARHKEEIEDMGSVSDRLLALRPVTFKYRKPQPDGNKPVQFGLIAEEVAEIFPELVVYNEAGQPQSVKYHLLSSLLLNELKKQAAFNRRHEVELKDLRALRSEVAELRELTARLAAREGLAPPWSQTVRTTGSPRSSP